MWHSSAIPVLCLLLEADVLSIFKLRVTLRSWRNAGITAVSYIVKVALSPKSVTRCQVTLRSWRIVPGFCFSYIVNVVSFLKSVSVLAFLGQTDHPSDVLYSESSYSCLFFVRATSTSVHLADSRPSTGKLI